MKFSRVLLFSLGALALALLAWLALNVLGSVEVVDKGELLPYVRGYTIWKIRILDRFEFFVEPDYRFSRDAFNTYILVGVAFISLTFATLLKRSPTPIEGKRIAFFVLMFFGANYLAADEFLGIHETLGHNMQFLARLVPFTHRPDDVIILFYLVPATLFIAVFFRIIVESRRAAAFLVAALVVFGMAALDEFLLTGFEEFLEVAAGILIISGVLTMGFHQMHRAGMITSSE